MKYRKDSKHVSPQPRLPSSRASFSGSLSASRNRSPGRTLPVSRMRKSGSVKACAIDVKTL